MRGFAGIARESGKYEIEADTENRGGYLISIRRTGERLEVAAKRYSDKSDSGELAVYGRHTKVRFRTHGSFDDTLRSFVTAIVVMLDSIGVDGYRSKWGHDFPSEEFEILKAQI